MSTLYNNTIVILQSTIIKLSQQIINIQTSLSKSHSVSLIPVHKIYMFLNCFFFYIRLGSNYYRASFSYKVNVFHTNFNSSLKALPVLITYANTSNYLRKEMKIKFAAN